MGKFVIKQAKNGVKFDLKANNGEVIASSEVYTTLSACKNGIESVRKNSAVAGIEDQTAAGFETLKNPKFEIYTDKAGEFRFRLKAANGQIIATGEGYKEKKSCKNGQKTSRNSMQSRWLWWLDHCKRNWNRCEHWSTIVRLNRRRIQQHWRHLSRPSLNMTRSVIRQLRVLLML